MKLQRVLAIVSLLAAPAAEAQVCQFWVAPPPAGNDGNPGTSAQPWATLDHASARVLAQGHSCRSQVKRFAGFVPRHPMEALRDALDAGAASGGVP